jgi:hypothetical protein
MIYLNLKDDLSKFKFKSDCNRGVTYTKKKQESVTHVGKHESLNLLSQDLALNYMLNNNRFIKL